jgi:hypothetical protein
MKHRPYQLPVQIGSLATSVGERFLVLKRGDKVSEGKPCCPIDSSSGVPQGYHKDVEVEATLNPTYWQGKGADRRSTNYAGVVKVTRMYSGLSGDCEWRPFVRLGKPDTLGVEMGKSTREARRRKSRRYAFKGHFLRNWGGLDMSGDGKSGYKAVCPSKSHSKHIKESEMAIVPDVSGVNINSREGRAISLYGFALEDGSHNCPNRAIDVFKRSPGKPEWIYRHSQGVRNMPNAVKGRTGGKPYEGKPHVRFGR